MKNSIRLLVVLVGLFSQAVLADGFSADQVKTMGDTVITSKLYMQGGKMRIETNMPNMPMTSVIIVDTQSGKSLMLMPEQKMYMVMPAGQDVDHVPDLAELEKEYKSTRKDLGTETVNGYKCSKTEVVFEDKSMGKITQWYSDKLQFIVKMVTDDSAQGAFTMELKNIKEQDVAAALFQVPAGYKEMGQGFGAMQGFKAK